MNVRTISLVLALALALATGCEAKKKAGAGPEKKTESTKTEAKKPEAKADVKKPEAKKPEAKAPAELAPPTHELAVGKTTRKDITEKFEAWKTSYERTKPSTTLAKDWANVPEDTQITVLFGTWCGDCMREVPQFWRDVESMGKDVPFEVHYVAVDNMFGAGPVDIRAYDPQAIPSFVVTRGGKELGRLVESPETTQSADLGRLLRGEATGVISGRGELLQSPTPGANP